MGQDYAEIKKNENDDAKKMYDLEQSWWLSICRKASRKRLPGGLFPFEGIENQPLTALKEHVS